MLLHTFLVALNRKYGHTRAEETSSNFSLLILEQLEEANKGGRKNLEKPLLLMSFLLKLTNTNSLDWGH